ncbi:MAG: AbrB/MazE/SpoVT family DNA-binding domain-containing protein [Chloroflexi bacterium]|nr:AbrB/MazE/SpoVT family DNA-binding domain-containing protein [Chloroflexota bacterium]
MSTTTVRQTRARVTEGGRVVIPADYRRQLGIEIGDELVMSLVDGELRLFTRQEAIRRAQEIARHHPSRGVSLVAELIAERRAEAACE